MNSLLEPIKYIADNFGPRIAGTEADHKTIEYIEQEFQKLTSDVQLEAFPVVGRSLQYLINFLVWDYFISLYVISKLESGFKGDRLKVRVSVSVEISVTQYSFSKYIIRKMLFKLDKYHA